MEDHKRNQVTGNKPQKATSPGFKVSLKPLNNLDMSNLNTAIQNNTDYSPPYSKKTGFGGLGTVKRLQLPLKQQ